MIDPPSMAPDPEPRRERLLEAGARLFAEQRFDRLSMAGIAREAGVSKALLYHYFPNKPAFLLAALDGSLRELADRTSSDPGVAPAVGLARSLDAFLVWVQAHPRAYENLLAAGTTVPEVASVIDRARDAAADRILAGAVAGEGGPSTVLRTAVRGWLGFTEAAIADWLEHGDLGRDELRGLLLGALLGAVTAAGE